MNRIERYGVAGIGAIGANVVADIATRIAGNEIVSPGTLEQRLTHVPVVNLESFLKFIEPLNDNVHWGSSVAALAATIAAFSFINKKLKR